MEDEAEKAKRICKCTNCSYVIRTIPIMLICLRCNNGHLMQMNINNN